ncbi:MAG: tetratricopeptide repeat protein [Candidatus Sumerlaeia bacterium]|nr:tetratricopeptide repeat protein [Candidatus Sumerlaeia bacterium]
MDKKAGGSWALWLGCALPLAVSIFFAQRRIDSPNVSSRMDTIQSLVERGTFCIDHSLRLFEVDVVKINGRWYSDKPPLLSVVGAALYWPLHKALGWTFARHAPRLYVILTVCLVGVPAALGLWLLGQCLLLAGCPVRAAGATVLLAAAGTMILPYSVTFNNHVPAAAAITAALYFLLRDRKIPSAANLCAAGFLAALAFNLDLAPGGIALAGFGLVAAAKPPCVKRAAWYALGAVVPLALYMFLNWLVTHDFKPIYLHPEYYNYPGSILLSYDALKRPFGKTYPAQIFHMTFGYRGLFSYSPILLWGLIEAVRQLRRGEDRLLAAVALAIPFLSAASYASQTGGMAGGSYGMRWLLPATPLLMFYTGQRLGRGLSRRGRTVFGAAAAFSILVAALGVPRPWSSNIRSPITVLDNLAYFGQVLWPPAKPPVYWLVEWTSLEKGYAYLEIGRWHMNNGYYTAAIGDLERARILDPSRSSLIDYYLGICYDASGSPDLAAAVYERLLEREPENTGAWNNYAQALRRMGLRTQALAALRKSLALDPDKVFTLRALGQLCWELGRREEAVKYWERALEIAPDQADVQALLENARK